MFNNPFSRSAQPQSANATAQAATTGLTPNTGAIVPFNSQQPVSTSLFGGSTGAFGSTAASGQQSNLFGVSPSPATTTATATNPFGSAFQSSNPSFGGAGATLAAQPATSATANPSFGSGSFGSAAPSSSLFGGSSSNTTQTSLFGGSSSSAAAPTSLFGTASTSTTTPSLFGMNASSGTAPSSAFGATSNVAPSSTFPGSSIFGSAPSFGSAFPASSTTPSAPGSGSSSIFQVSGNTPAFGTTFSQPTASSSFSQPASSTSSFSQPTSSTSSSSSTFQQPTPFGTTSSTQFGSSAFNGGTTMSSSVQPSLFGSSMTSSGSVFGNAAPQTSFAGQTQSFGSGAGLFGSSTSGTQPSQFQPQQTTNLSFGSSTSSLPFGATPSLGTGNPPYTTTTDTDNQTTLHLQSISAMPAYISKSVEELRLEDYHRGRKAPGYGSPGVTTPTATTPFGIGSTPSPFGVGAPSSGFGTTSGFGSTSSNQPFANTSMFGAAATQPTTSIFGTASQPASSANTTGSMFPSASSTSTTPFSTAPLQPGGNTVFQPTPFQPTNTSSSIFGSFPTTSAPAATAPSSFATTTPFTSSTLGTGGMFGQQTQPQPQPQTQPQQTASSFLGSTLFGAGQQQPSSATATTPSTLGTGGSFFQNQMPSSGSLFSQPQQPTSTMTSSLNAPGMASLGAPVTAAPSTTPAPSTFSFQLQPSGASGQPSSLPSFTSTNNRPLTTSGTAPLTPFTQPWSTPAMMSSATGGTPVSLQTPGAANMTPKASAQFGRHPWLDAPPTPTASTPLLTTTSMPKATSSIGMQSKLGKSCLSQPLTSSSLTQQSTSSSLNQQSLAFPNLNGSGKVSLISSNTLRQLHPNLPSLFPLLSVKKSLKTLVVDFNEDRKDFTPSITNRFNAENRNSLEKNGNLGDFHVLGTQGSPPEHLNFDNSQESVLSGSRSRVQSLPGGFYISPPVTEIIAACINSKVPLTIKEFLLGRKHFGDVSFLSPVVDIASFLPVTDEKSFVLRLFGKEAVSSADTHLEEDDDDEGNENNPIVSFGPRSITIYPEGMEKPPVNIGFNLPARIRLEGCYPRRSHDSDNQIHESSVLDAFVKKLRSVPGTTFLSYEETTGLWVFSVEHF